MAHHHHQRAHLYVDAQRKREPVLVEREPEPQLDDLLDEIATFVSIVFVTAENTYPSSVPLQWVTPTVKNGNPIQTSASDNDDDDASTSATAKPAATSPVTSKTTRHQTTFHTATSGSQSEILATGSPSSATRLALASSSPGSSTSAALSAASATSSAVAAASTGLSGGAKAGLALGILILIGGICAAVLVFYKRKKDNQKGERLEDDEKNSFAKPAQNETWTAPAPVPAMREPAGSVRSVKTASTAPRLSLRPVTQFSPNLGLQQQPFGAKNVNSPTKANGNLAPASAWERRPSNAAADPFTDPVDPFGDRAVTMDSPTIVVTPDFSEKQVPPAPPSKSPEPPMLPELPAVSSPIEPSFNGAAIGVAVAGGAAMTAAAANKENGRREVPKPLQTNSDAAIDAPMASPAPSNWTDDVPASPGPAPMGAPSIAPAPGPNNVHRVQMDFAPSMEDELGIRAGQLVRMLHEYDDGWALCIRLDRSQQGVVPRTCLSKHPVKPRTGPPPRGPGGPRGPMHPMGPNAPRPLTPNGRNSPGPGSFPNVPRPGGPNGRNSPGPFANQPRPMSPSGRPMSPGGRQMAPANRPRANSNSGPPPSRSMSPGPYGSPRKGAPSPDMQGRRRSNSASQVMARRNSPPGPSPLTQFGGGVPRKPVPGQAL